MIASVASPQLEIAQRLLQAGISVIPIGRNKQPAVAWKEYQSRLPTEDELTRWFSTPDQHGIGIVCGAVSGNLEVIDFDLRNWDALVEVVNCFQSNVLSGREDFPLESLALVQTPGPGAQLVYRCVEPVGGSQKLARHNGVLDEATGEYKNPGYFIETRGEGGYALSVGSPGICHPTGGIYRHIGGPQLHELQPITFEQRDILLGEARYLGIQEKPRTEPAKGGISSVTPDSAGVDYAARTSWSEILEPHGFTHVASEGDTQQWKRPGTTNPVSATTNHDGSDLFYAFSPNCGHGIEAGRGYSKFAMFTMLNHGGDFSASAKALVAMGFGAKPDHSHIDLSALLDREQPETWQDPFGFQTFEDFMSETEETEYLCTDIIAKGQSAIIGGPEKSLKTGIGAMDLGYSLATGTAFLGRFPCPKAVSVGIMTGETSKPKLRRQFRNRISADSLLYPDRPAPCLYITASLPDMSSAQQLQQIQQVISVYSLDVMIIDPAYLSLGSMADHTSNLAKMGNMLRQLELVSKSTGCTLILLHHTNRKHEAGKPLTLRDLSGAGFAEWARQWVLISPRKPFDPDTYQHCLWMVVGGSAGVCRTLCGGCARKG